MTESAVSTPNDSGELTQDQAIERLLARGQADKAEKPADRNDPGDDDEDAPIIDDDQADEDNAQVEGGEFSDEETDATGDPVVKFDDGTEMPLSEVKRGFLRQQDYTRKTQETAELRRAVESERGAYLNEKRQISDQLGPLIQQAISIIDNPSVQAELNELRQLDPGAYAVRMMEQEAKRNQLSQLHSHQMQLRQAAEREESQRMQQARSEMADQSRAVLMEKIPAAKKDFASWYQGLGKWVLEQGVPAEAWDNEVDHRIVTLAWKAMQYDNAKRKAQSTGDQLRKAPQPLRPGAARPAGHAQQRALREATERAEKSHSFDDAVALQIERAKSRRSQSR